MLSRSITVGTWLLTAACSAAPISSIFGDDELVVRSGTSFGMCLGYCSRELRIGRDEIVLTESSRDSVRNPTRVTRLPMDSSEWSEIESLIEADDLDGLEEVYGCPDCADGGAEWIEIDQGDSPRRVTFEFGGTVPRAQALIDKVRQIRSRFPESAAPNP